VDDQGAFAALKENLRFSEPFLRVLVPAHKTKNTQRVFFCWWTIRDSNRQDKINMPRMESFERFSYVFMWFLNYFF
jgi:hypothetical protein